MYLNSLNALLNASFETTYLQGQHHDAVVPNVATQRSETPHFARSRGPGDRSTSFTWGLPREAGPDLLLLSHPLHPRSIAPPL